MSASAPITLFEDPFIVQLFSPAAIAYAKEKSGIEVDIFTVENMEQNIIEQYNKGCRKFIFATTSGQIISIEHLIEKYTDAKFVGAASTVISLRGKYKNLYFTCPSDYYLTRVLTTDRSVIVYDLIEDPFVAEVVEILSDGGRVPSYDMNDPAWRQYETIFMVSVVKDIWKVVNDNVIPEINYTIYAVESFPPFDITFSPNITAISVIYPMPTALPQINSTWNILTKHELFSQCNNITAIYPLLFTQDWDKLVQVNIMTTVDQRATYYFTRYLPYFPMNIQTNDKNRHVKNYKDFIWITDEPYVDKWSCQNWHYVMSQTNRIKKHVVTNNVVCEVMKHYQLGYKHFILDASSAVICELQEYDLDGLFICNQATDPSLRCKGSNYLFTLCSDTTFIEDRVQGYNTATNRRMVVVMGPSDNVNPINFVENLEKENVTWIRQNELGKIPSDTIIILVVGNQKTYDRVYRYVWNNFDKLPSLVGVPFYQDYPTKLQFEHLSERGLERGTVFWFFFELNYSALQTFQETKYFKISNPKYVSTLGYNYLKNLSNILFVFPLQVLFDYGYIIDV